MKFNDFLKDSLCESSHQVSMKSLKVCSKFDGDEVFYVWRDDGALDDDDIKKDIVPLAEKSHKILMKAINAVNFLYSVAGDLEEIVPKLNRDVPNNAGDFANWGLKDVKEALEILNSKKSDKGALDNLAKVLYSFGLGTHSR